MRTLKGEPSLINDLKKTDYQDMGKIDILGEILFLMTASMEKTRCSLSRAKLLKMQSKIFKNKIHLVKYQDIWLKPGLMELVTPSTKVKLSSFLFKILSTSPLITQMIWDVLNMKILSQECPRIFQARPTLKVVINNTCPEELR